MGPLFGATSCPVRHVGYTVSGAVRIQMDDGETVDIAPGMAFDVPPGHDKWVLGDEPWVTVEWGGSGRAMSSRTIQARIFRGERQYVAECLDLPVVTEVRWMS